MNAIKPHLEMNGDKVEFITPDYSVPPAEHGCFVKATTVMDKETFIKCFKEWVLPELESEYKKKRIDPWVGEKPHAEDGFVAKYCLGRDNE